MSSSAPPTEVGIQLPAPAAGRFELRGILGRGASGVVFRALDRETGGEVALKTLTSTDVDHVYHLKAEFRSLAQIVHPNLVHLDELVVASDSCFFTMELLRGKTFAEYARELGGDEVPRRWSESSIERLRRVVAQIASGVSALHEAGKLHRDVKPTNILVTDDERAVLVDFGLCTALRLVARTRNPLVGTLLYMAPEQAWGKPLSRAADWYAFGAVLYEALVGRGPFDSEGSRLLFEKERAVSVPAQADAVALPMLRLAAALMDPLPERRPRSSAVIAALSDDGARPRHAASADDVPFVGRLAERAALDGALNDVIEGRPAVVHVEGVSGVGKTELVERYLDSVERRPGAVVLRGRCHSRESVSFNGFDGIVDELSEWMSKLESSELGELIPEDASALLEIFPVLRRIAAVARPPDADRAQPYALRQRAFRALRELLASIAERYTVVVALDDLQSGGADTASLLTDVFRPPSMPRLLLVLTYRAAEDEHPSPMLTTLRERAPVLFDSVHHVTMRPLGLAESGVLCMHLLGRDDEPAKRLAQRIAEESSGHPLFLRELALAVESSPEVAVPRASPDLGRLLAERIRQLPSTERTLLELASIASRPVPRRVLLAAAGAGGRARPDLARLGRKHLLRETSVGGEPAFEPYHAKVREALLDSWPVEARRSRHRALADALLAEMDVDADALVDQLRGAGDSSGAARYAWIAAGRAHAALAFDRAVQLYRLALAFDGEGRTADEPRWRVRSRLAAALVDAGRSREAADAYALASREAARQASEEATDLERRAAEQYLRCGDVAEGTRHLRRVLDAFAIPYPSSAASALATMLALRVRLSMRGLGFRSRRADEIPAGDLARVDACWSAGLGCAWVDSTRSAAFQARYMLLALDAGDPSRASLALSTEASQLSAAGGRKRLARARGLMERALRAAEQGGDHRAHAFTLLMAGSVEFYASRWRRSLDLCSHAESLLRENQSRSEWELMTAHCLSLASLAYLGDLRKLRERQTQLLAEARDRGNLLASVCLACGPANIGWLADDDPLEARRRADEALASSRCDDLPLPRYLHIIASAQIALYRDDPQAALALVSSEWPRLVAMMLYVQNFRVTLRHLRARCALGVLAHPRSRTSSLERARLTGLVRREARRLASEDVAWAPALGRTVEAGLAVLTGDDAAAVVHLSRASAEFRDLDMALHAASVDHERGRLIGGAAGRALQRSAEAWMIDERVRSPERLASTLVPGVWRGGSGATTGGR